MCYALCTALYLTAQHPVQAQPRRQAKVARQIEREVGSLLVHDEVSCLHAPFSITLLVLSAAG